VAILRDLNSNTYIKKKLFSSTLHNMTRKGEAGLLASKSKSSCYSSSTPASRGLNQVYKTPVAAAAFSPALGIYYDYD
jgi:hypothetical protein